MLVSAGTKEQDYWPAYILDPRLFVEWLEKEMEQDDKTFGPILKSMMLGTNLKVSPIPR